MGPALFTPKRVRRLIFVGVILVALLLGLALYRASTFHVIKTNPGTRSVLTVSPFFDIYFSKPLSQSSLSISATDSIVASYTISDKIIKLSLKEPLQLNRSYTITIASVSDTSGQQLNSLSFSFRAKYVPSNKVPADQAKVLLQQQTKASAKAPIAFTGTGALVNTGLSSTQVADFEQAIKNFAQAQHIQLTSVAVVQNSVATEPLNGSGIFVVDFAVTINGTVYKAKVQYSNLTAIDMLLLSGTGQQVFDSGQIDVSGAAG